MSCHAGGPKFRGRNGNTDSQTGQSSHRELSQLLQRRHTPPENALVPLDIAMRSGISHAALLSLPPFILLPSHVIRNGLLGGGERLLSRHSRFNILTRIYCTLSPRVNAVDKLERKKQCTGCIHLQSPSSGYCYYIFR